MLASPNIASLLPFRTQSPSRHRSVTDSSPFNGRPVIAHVYHIVPPCTYPCPPHTPSFPCFRVFPQTFRAFTWQYNRISSKYHQLRHRKARKITLHRYDNKGMPTQRFFFILPQYLLIWEGVTCIICHTICHTICHSIKIFCSIFTQNPTARTA